MNRRICGIVAAAIIVTVVVFNIYVVQSGHNHRGDEKEELLQYKALNATLASLRKELHSLKAAALEQSSLVTFDNAVLRTHPRSVSTTALATPSATAHPTVKPTEGFGSVHAASRSKQKRVAVFTMDSISSYEKNSLTGGAAGTVQSYG
jgi:hypothetical protein